MFNLFKKSTEIGDFYNRLSSEEKKAIIVSLSIIGLADGEIDDQNSESAFIEYIRKQLNVEIQNALLEIRKNGISNLLKPLLNCTEREKAVLIYLWRGMANIDKQANDEEIQVIQDLSKILNFDLDDYYSDPTENIDDKNKICLFFNRFIFPNGNKDIEEGVHVLNLFLTTKVEHDYAKHSFIHLSVMYELAKIRSISFLEDEINLLKLDITPEHTVNLHKYLKSKIIIRMKNVLNIK